jgi:hypothetical protein
MTKLEIRYKLLIIRLLWIIISSLRNRVERQSEVDLITQCSKDTADLKRELDSLYLGPDQL